MVFINRGVNMANAKGAMTMEELKEWVLRDLDANKDVKISSDHQLADILRRNGEWFPGYKAGKLIRSANFNRNGVVDENEIGKLEEFYQKQFSLRRSGQFAEWRSSGGMDFRDGKHRRKEISDRLDSLIRGRKQKINAGKPFQNYDFTEDITEAGPLSPPAKSEAESMFLTEEQLKEVFKRFEALEEPAVLHRKDLEKAFNHFGLFFPRHADTVFDAKKEGSVKLTELDDLVNSAVRLGYTVN